ncbi:hypothetical protein KACC15558_08550 [Brevibacterium ammoniilyticum]|uniref:Uncharacterized protein n=1 Tax=Brevibacterium ammoniilyticum TaxID=1046555 RepID=A0ABP9U3H3_9MICO
MMIPEVIMNHGGMTAPLDAAVLPPAARVEDRISMDAFRDDGVVYPCRKSLPRCVRLLSGGVRSAPGP